VAAAFATVRGPPATSGVCFGCDKPGHLKRNCPALKGDKPKTASVCSWCRRGPHSANQCCSKYNIDRRLLQGFQGNRNQSTGGQLRALPQMPQPPLQMTAQQMPNGTSPQVFA
ncbi:GAK5 protein, partial [Malurus elegans]|nr:GAK5 protein [Malurus elegans]